MNPLLLTLTFLTLIGILTSSELVQYTQHQFSHDLICKALENENAQNNSLQEALLEDLTEEHLPKLNQKKSPALQKNNPSKSKAKKASKSLHYNSSRPPNNSRLNFFFVIQEEDIFWKQTAETLMRQLYGNCDFFNQIPHAEQRILAALIKNKMLTQKFVYPDDLASLDLEDEILQNIFYHMLKGDLAPSLLNFITYDNTGTPNQKKLNLLFASSELLQAVFPQKSDKLEHLIHEVWEEILASEQSQDPEQQLGRVAIRKNLFSRFEQLCTDTSLSVEQAKQYFDFTLGKPGTILFVEDPQSGFVTRTKIPARHQR